MAGHALHTSASPGCLSASIYGVELTNSSGVANTTVTLRVPTAEHGAALLRLAEAMLVGVTPRPELYARAAASACGAGCFAQEPR